MIRHGAILVLAALVALIGSATWWTVDTIGRPPSVTASKLAQAERVTYYRMTRTAGPRFLMAGTETELRVITHVRLPAGTAYDPLRRIRYGIRLRLRDGGDLVWEREIHTQSRQSKALCVRDARLLAGLDDPCTLDVGSDKFDFTDTECPAGRWRCENSFIRDEGVQISDDRLLSVVLPDDVPTDSVLEISLIGDIAEGLVRVYNQVERSGRSRERAARTIGPDKQRAVVWSNTYVPWSLVPLSERVGRLRYRYERMSAIGEDGIDYRTQVIYYTGFRLPLDSLTEDEAIVVHHRRYAALNLIGPAELTLLVDTDPPGEHADGDPALEIGWVSARLPDSAGDAVGVAGEPESPEPPARPVVPPAPRASSASAPVLTPAPAVLGLGVQRLQIPPGLHSMHIRTDSSRPLGLQLLGPREVAFGAPRDARGQRGRLRPDEIRMPAAITGPGLDPVVVVGGGEQDALSRTMRIQVRWLEPPSPPGEPDDANPPAGRAEPSPDARLFTGELIVALEGGQVTRQDLPGVRAPYEWLDRTGRPATGVSEPIDVDLIVPEHIGRVELSTSRPAALRLFRYLPIETVYELPYRAVSLADAQWRYARIERRMWWPMSPINQQELADDDRIVTLVAQARLERQSPRLADSGADDADGGDTAGRPAGRSRPPVVPTPGVAIEPLDAPERHLVLEPLDDAPRQWHEGMLAQLTDGRAWRYQFTADAPRRAKVYYWIAASELGEEISIAIDGELDGDRVLRFTPPATHGYYELPALAPGVHSLRATSRARSLSLYVTRPPAEPGVARYAMRWVYALGPDNLRVRVVKPGNRPLVLNVIVYAPWLDELPEYTVRTVIGGARPARMPGLWTSGITYADRRVVIPAATSDVLARFTDRVSGAAGYPRRIPIRLGDDMTPGEHEIDIYTGYRGRLWARFFVTQTDRDPRDRTLQWRFREPP